MDQFRTNSREDHQRLHTLDHPQAIVLAGPNGAGKTTISPRFLGQDVEFVNADLIGADLRSTNPNITGADFTAGRIVSARLTSLASQRKSFCFETNLASKGLVGRIDRLSLNGYETKMVFVALPDVEIALARVAARVLAGGHNVPEETVRRRFKAGLHYFFDTYRSRVDTGPFGRMPMRARSCMIANSEDHLETIYDQKRWDHLLKPRSLGEP